MAPPSTAAGSSTALTGSVLEVGIGQVPGVIANASTDEGGAAAV